MNFGILRLAFAILWLFAAWFFYYQGHLAPGQQNAGWFAGSPYDLMAVFAILMFVWNLVRWFVVSRRPVPAPPNPLQPRATEPPASKRVDEYHPEFDFGNPPPRHRE